MTRLNYEDAEEPYDYTKTNETYKLTVLEPENLKHFNTFGFVNWEIAQRNRLNLLHESKYTAKFILEEKIEYSKILGDGWDGKKTRIVNRIIETKEV